MSLTLEASRIVLDGLMRRYVERVPDVSTVVDGMIKEGIVSSIEDIENDHIAFRTIGVPLLGIQSLERVFLHYGYEKKDYFRFEKKKLNAHWYSPADPKDPRIFISELCVDELSLEVQEIIRKYTDTVTEDPTLNLDLDDGKSVDEFLHSGLWKIPTWKEFEMLRNESEYAAWTIYNRYYLNHFTISVHNLPKGYNTLEDFNAFLKKLGITLNSAGGEAKVSADGLLIQSSTVAAMIDAEFPTEDGGTEVHKISGSYVEFAERKPLPEFESLPESEIKREHRRDGFEAGNADKIFESTYQEQTKKRS